MRSGWRAVVIFAAQLALGAACSPLFGDRLPEPPTATFSPPAPAIITLAPSDGPTQIPEAFALDLTPLPSATALPTIEIPSQAPDVGLQVWDGLPTYPSESRPDYFFRVIYDPLSWGLTTNQFGYPALAHRAVAGCVLAPSAGRGLPLNARVDHEVRSIGFVSFQVDTASVAGQAKFVVYTGGDGVIYTGFEVQMVEMADLCLPAAEGVLATLTSVPVAEATPVNGP